MPSPLSVVERLDAVTGPFAYLRPLGDRQAVDALTRTLDHMVIDSRPEVAEDARAIGILRQRAAYPSAERWPLDPRPSPLVCHPLAFAILIASPRPSEPPTDREFASLSCPRYSFRLFGQSPISYSLLPHPFGSVSTAIMPRDVP